MILPATARYPSRARRLFSSSTEIVVYLTDEGGGNRRVCSSLDIVAVATAVAALFVIAASAWGGEDFFYGYEHHQLGWSCCGSADVPEWNEIAERLKSTHYKDNAQMTKQIDALTQSLAGRTKRTLATLLGSTEYKGMSYLMRVKQKMEEAQYYMNKEKRKIEDDRKKLLSETEKTCSEIQLDLDEYATRNKEYTEAVAQRPKTEAEEEQRFRRAMTKYQNEIDRLKKAIEEEKAKLKTKGKKGSRRKKATTT